MTDQEKLTLPVLKHRNCINTECKVCLKDALALADFLEQEIGDIKIDFLGDYRNWLDRNKIPAETEHGWFTEEVFAKVNIDAYLLEWTT